MQFTNNSSLTVLVFGLDEPPASEAELGPGQTAAFNKGTIKRVVFTIKEGGIFELKAEPAGVGSSNIVDENVIGGDRTDPDSGVDD